MTQKQQSNDIKTILLNAPLYSLGSYGRRSREILNSLSQYKHDFTVRALIVNHFAYSNRITLSESTKAFIESYRVKEQFKDPYVEILVGPPPMLSPTGGASATICFTHGGGFSKIPANWVQVLNTINATVVPSTHEREVFKESGVNNVFSISGITDKNIIKSKPQEGLLSDLKSAVDFTDSFIFLTTGRFKTDLGDPNGILTAAKMFSNAFSKNRKHNAKLIIKTSLAGTNELDKTMITNTFKSQFSAYDVDSKNIYFVHGEMTDDELAELFNVSNAFISCASASAWNYMLFDAATYGLPTLVTGWGGHMDYINPKKSTVFEYELEDVGGFKRAKLEEEDIKRKMRRCIEKYSGAVERADNLKTDIRKQFAPDTVGPEIIHVINKILGKSSLILS